MTRRQQEIAQMFADWIKMRTDLYRDPKVCLMADALLKPTGELSRCVSRDTQRDMSVTRNVTRNAVVGALVSVWGVCRHRGKRNGDDLVMPNCSYAVLDDIADLPGFGAAMAAVGWAIQSGESVVFPRFFEDFNVEPSQDAKAKAAERQRRHREKLTAERNALRDVTVTSQSNVREEKRREEKKTPPNPPSGGASGKRKRDAQPAEHHLFAGFWSAFPRKEDRRRAAAAFAHLNPDEALFAVMMAALERQKTWPKWVKDGGEFIPYPATWLNGRRWEDQPPAVLPPPVTPRSNAYAVYDEVPMPQGEPGDW